MPKGTELIDVALGKAPADLVIRGATLVNVYSRELCSRTTIAVKGSRIASVGDLEPSIAASTVVIDASQLCAVPGLIDGHIHIESTMLDPVEFAKVVIPRGTTAVMIDPHEIANVLGVGGVQLMLSRTEGIPLKAYVQAPSCVPSTINLETAGAKIGPKEVQRMLKWPRIVGLGEVMNYPAVLAGDRKLRLMIQETQEVRKVVEGHAPGLLGRELNAYLSAGIVGDHESTTEQELVEKLRLGCVVEIREGSTSHNLATLIRALKSHNLSTRHAVLVSDDRHAGDLMKLGHMDYNVRRAIEEGLDPIDAITMATLNTAEHFRVDTEIGGIAPGKRADIILTPDISKMRAEAVIADGKVVARNGILLAKISSPRFPPWSLRTIHLKRRLQPKDFVARSKTENGSARTLVIETSGEVLTKKTIEDLPVRDFQIQNDLERDILKIAVIERHKRTGNIGRGFVKGFGLKAGAISSSVAHDSHNICVVGTNDSDMVAAANEVARLQGGLVSVKDGTVLAELPLPFAGLMSTQSIEEVNQVEKQLSEAAKNLGCAFASPFMVMSFLSLAVIPEVRLTDKGIVDVSAAKFIPVVCQ
ncbi:adenine deaminase [Candidatus Bathyarchaeota archaeon]|nr:adenine deaminase [Candidatus Bathyarchaeota archaeon]